MQCVSGRRPKSNGVGDDVLEKKKQTARAQPEQDACYMWQRKLQQTELSDRGQLMSRYINFMNPHPLHEFAATHVLNGSCRQKRMSLCWNKWRGENGVKMTPLRCINLHLFILSFFFFFLKTAGFTESEGSLLIRQYKTRMFLTKNAL